MKIDDKVDAVFIPDSPSRIKASDYNQIKNEIQECIVLAGLTPTKDVIQLPSALKTLTEQSGAEEIEKIEAEGNAQVAAVNTAGNAQINAVTSAGQDNINNINATGASYVQAAKDWANKTDGPVANGEYSAKKYAQDAQESAKQASKLPIGSVYFSQSGLAVDNVGALPLFTGETIASANTLYPEFYAWVLAHTELQCTSEEYESALGTYGECPKYVVSSGSLRLPLLKNYIKAANTTEGVKNISAGLPNLTWNLTVGEGTFSSISPEIVLSGGQKIAGGNNWVTNVTADYSAQRGNPIYGNSDTVTPPSTTLYPWVCAYTAAVAASTAQASQFQAALSGKVDLPSGKTQADVDFVVESYSDDDGNWYRVYKSGWVEQGGSFASSSTVTVSFLKPFLDTAYTFISSSGANITSTSKKSGTTIIFDPTYNASTKVGGDWAAYGKGAENV